MTDQPTIETVRGAYGNFSLLITDRDERVVIPRDYGFVLLGYATVAVLENADLFPPPPPDGYLGFLTVMVLRDGTLRFLGNHLRFVMDVDDRLLARRIAGRPA